MRSARLVLLALLVSGCMTTNYPARFTFRYNLEHIDTDSWVDPMEVFHHLKECMLVAVEGIGVEPPRMQIQFMSSPRGEFRFEDETYSVEVLMMDGKVNSRHAHMAAFVTVHEFVEFALVQPDLHGASLYSVDRENRWLGDGLANFLAGEALLEVGSPAPEWCHQLGAIKIAQEMGIESVSLQGWKTIVGDVSEAPEDMSMRAFQENLLRYAAAEHTVDRWYRACQRKGQERPAAELLAWLQKNPRPTHEEVVHWMEALSGTSLRLDREISLDSLEHYFAERYGRLTIGGAPRGAN